MSVPNNVLQQVATYCDAELGYLENLNCFIHELNTKFKGFDEPKNLGNAVNLELPNRAIASKGLVANLQGVQQRLVPFVCDQAANSAHDFTAQEFMFNVKDYMMKFGKARVEELSAEIESNVALNAVSGVPVMIVDSNGQSVPTGALHTESGPYRFYGNGITAINSFGQLADMESIFREYGSAKGSLKVFLPNMAVSGIVNSGLNQFVPDRNEKIANSWDLGTYQGGNSRFFRSNLLPVHISGTAGQNQDTLTLSDWNDHTGANITTLTFTGVSSNSGAVVAGDVLEFLASSGINYLTFTGHKPSQAPVQCRVLANADALAGTVIVSITPALRWTPGLNQNLTKPIASGMTAKVAQSHRAGLVVGGDAFYLAMPPLPSTRPFDSSTTTDSDTGVSLRNYFGFLMARNQTAYVTDCIWAGLAVPENCMRICFPL